MWIASCPELVWRRKFSLELSSAERRRIGFQMFPSASRTVP
jgi:hypothetical protein